MAVILLILKIIGIILLILLGLILLILALVLFVPVRYRVSGDIRDKASVRIVVTWMLHLFRFDTVFDEGEFDSRLRIFGITPKGRRTAENSKEEPDEEADVRTADDGLTDETGAWAEHEEMKDGDASIERQTKGSYDAAHKFLSGIRTKFTRLKKRFYTLKRKLADIKSMVTDENNKTAILGILAELKYLLCHFRFRRLETNLTFSLGDPALTGQVLGALCMLPFLYWYQVQIYPDFEAEKTYVKGTFEIRGRARGIHLLISVVRLLKEKEFRVWLKKLLD